MIIHKVVTDRKPMNSIECPLLGTRTCGKQYKVLGSKRPKTIRQILGSSRTPKSLRFYRARDIARD